MRTVEPSPRDLATRDGRPSWNITPVLAEILEAPDPPSRVFFVLGARNCHGCEVLAAQLERHADVLRPGTEIIEGIGGDFATGDFIRDLSVGLMSLSAPGVPVGILFDAFERSRLAFRALTLGPVDDRDPRAALRAMADGRSQWVEEADGASIKVCVSSVCFRLDRSNAFHSPFSVLISKGAPS